MVDVSEVADEDCRMDTTYKAVADDRAIDALSEARPGKRARTRRQRYWMMLDGFLCPLKGDDFSGLMVEGTTSKGEKIVVRFSVLKPPMASRLFYTLHLKQEKPGSSSGDNDGSWISEAKAVAADGECILLRFLIVDVPEEEYDDTGELINVREIREELFVCRASPLSLINLPRCGHRRINLGMRNNIGILCHIDGEFALAHLTVTKTRCSDRSDFPIIADLCRILSRDGQWRITESVPIVNAEGQHHLEYWVTDTVVTFGQYICWVDYLRGVLFCDVFSPHPQLSYVSLPVDPFLGDFDKQRDCRGPLSAYRSVCVTEGGNALKFVDVALNRHWCYWFNVLQQRPAISTWKMTLSSMRWEVDGCVELEEILPLTNQMRIPCTGLEYPLVDRNNPELIYLMLMEGIIFSGQTYLFKFDMRYRVASWIPYRCGSFSKLGADIYKSTTCCNLFYMEAFLPSEFSKFLDLDECQARGREDVGGLVEAPEFSMLADGDRSP